MSLTFDRYNRPVYAVQYTLGNQADVLAYMQSIYGTNAYLSGNTVINPQEALSPGDWIVKSDTAIYDAQTNAAFTEWFDARYVAPTPYGNLGILATTPGNVVGGYSWTYNATSKGLPAYTPNVQSTAFLGGLLDLLQAARLSDLNSIRVALENLRVFAENVAKQHNQMSIDLKNAGLIA